MSETYTLLTGASSGFGRSIAHKLSTSRRLVLVGRSAKTLEAVRAGCKAPDHHLLWVRDLSEVDGLSEELGVQLAQHDIVIDHFIHSAGIIRNQYARAIDMSSVWQLFNVNLFAAMALIQPLVQKRVNKGHLKSITLISSIATRVGSAGYAVYGASKGAVNAFSLGLAVELAPAVRVNTVSPGIVATEMNRDYFADPAFVKFVRATHPLGFGQAEDVAGAVEFLSSDAARWITGQELVVDGGRTIFSRTPDVAETKAQQGAT